MGKSLRSKSKLRAKSIKRKGEFSQFVDDRNARLAQKSLEHLKKQKEEKAAQEAQKGEGATAEASDAIIDSADAMTDSADAKSTLPDLSKIKTSGKGKKKKGNKRIRSHFRF